MNGAREAGAPEVFRCSAAARWLPRALAGATLSTSLFMMFRIEHQDALGVFQALRVIVVLLGAALALWLLRRGAELRVRVTLEAARLRLAYGARSAALDFESIGRLEYETPFAASRSWIPATILLDRQGRPWRLPALLSRGDGLIAELLQRSGRNDLAAWVDALNLSRRMGRASRLVGAGYLVAAAILAVGLVFYFR